MGNFLCDTFKEVGYLHCRQFFDSWQIDEIRRDAENIFELQLDAKNYDLSKGFEPCLYDFFQKHQGCFINCGKHIQHLVSLHRLGVSDRLLARVKTLGVKTPNISTRPVLYFNSRHLATKEIYWKTPAHQDWYSMQGSLNSIVVWVPLMDIDEKLGALQIVPGSHNRGNLATKLEDGFGLVDGFKDEEFKSIEVKKGDALFFSSLLVHRSGDNITENIRWSCHLRFNDLKEEDFINRDYPHPYIYRPVELKDGG